MRLNGQEREALLDIIGKLSPELDAVRQTVGRAYDDAEMQREYEHWVKPENDAGAVADLDVVRGSLDSGEDTLPLTEAQALCWLRALNYLRLAAGRILGVKDDAWMEEVDATTRKRYEYGVLMALGFIQEELVAALES